MKEKVLVSACLLGVNCKYDGHNNENDKVLKYLEDKEIIPICPEIMGGLSTPRDPSERVGKKVYSNKGLDVTDKFTRGAEETLRLARKLNVHKAILKARSPSCGYQKIYDGTFNHQIIDGHGIEIGINKLRKIAIYNTVYIDMPNAPILKNSQTYIPYTYLEYIMHGRYKKNTIKYIVYDTKGNIFALTSNPTYDENHLN